MNQKEWLDVKSPCFYYMQPTQHIGVMEFGTKLHFFSTHHQVRQICNTIFALAADLILEKLCFRVINSSQKK